MSDYLLASPEEIARLQLQARVWEAEAEAMLHQIGIQPGWACVDMGCGAMGILGLLSHLVGSEGRVVGVDTGNTHLQAARAYIHHENLENVELLEADVQHTGLPRASFDFVHARFVLPYVNVGETLQEMIALARPGGIVALQEPDQDSWNYYPANPEWPRLRAIIEQAFGLQGDINIGRRIFGLLRDAGLERVKVRAGVVALQDNHPYMRLPMIAMNALRRPILDNGFASEAELDDLLTNLEQRIADPATFAIMFTVVQVWGYKPL